MFRTKKRKIFGGIERMKGLVGNIREKGSKKREFSIWPVILCTLSQLILKREDFSFILKKQHTLHYIMKSKNIYSLPLKENTIFLAISSPRAHFSHWKYAIDFTIDFNVPILSPMDGIIWNVKDDSTEGGDDDKYIEWKYQNLITIKHSNNEYSQFVHLANRSSLVKIGDKIKRGDPIARGIGMIGCTTAPHLHMMVFIVKDKIKDECESLEIQFDKKVKIIKNGKEHIRELAKPKFKKLRELEEKYHIS